MSNQIIYCRDCCKYIYLKSFKYHSKTEFHINNSLDLGLDQLFKEPKQKGTIKTFFIKEKKDEIVKEKKKYNFNKKKTEQSIRDIRDLYERLPGLSYNKIANMLKCGSFLTRKIIEEIQEEERKQGFTRDSLGKIVYFKDLHYHRLVESELDQR